MSLTITVTMVDSINGTTTDVCAFSDFNGATVLSVLATANAPQPTQQQIRQAQQNNQPAPTVTPLTYDQLYHMMAQNWFASIQGRVTGLQTNAAIATATATAQQGIQPLAPTMQSTTTPVASGTVSAGPA